MNATKKHTVNIAYYTQSNTDMISTSRFI